MQKKKLKSIQNGHKKRNVMVIWFSNSKSITMTCSFSAYKPCKFSLPKKRKKIIFLILEHSLCDTKDFIWIDTWMDFFFTKKKKKTLWCGKEVLLIQLKINTIHVRYSDKFFFSMNFGIRDFFIRRKKIELMSKYLLKTFFSLHVVGLPISEKFD